MADADVDKSFQDKHSTWSSDDKVRWPRFITGTVVVVYLGLVGVYLERQVRLAAKTADVLLRDRIVPNYYHVNNDRDIFYLDKGRGALNKFGRDFLDVSGSWERLCRMDSDYDGYTNGQELGDPCCRWKAAAPNSRFSVANSLEYRRWFLTNPGDNQSSWLSRGGRYAEPEGCGEYDAALYTDQFSYWYHMRLRTRAECDPAQIKHMFGQAAVAVLLVYWLRRGLLKDLLPFRRCSAGKDLRAFMCIGTSVVSFLYMDLLSGMAHLCLDYSPNWIPILGPLANSFQQHHRDPSLLARSCGTVWLNDMFILIPFAGPVLMGANLTRISTLFYFWGLCFALLFLAAHPWAHMHKDMVPWPVAVAQEWGLLLDQETHMSHHADLESQFTILAGKTDFVIDSLCGLFPPHRYDIWLFIFTTWMLVPVACDIRYRDLINRATLRNGVGVNPAAGGGDAKCSV